MRVYIATRFDQWGEAAIAAARLEAAGHEVTSRWIAIAEQLEGDCNGVPVGDPRRLGHALDDLIDVLAADAMIVVVPAAGGTGMWWEAGYAHGLGKRVLYVGPGRERTLFAELDDCFDTLEEAVAAL